MNPYKKNLEEYKHPVKVQLYSDNLGKQKMLKEKINKASKAIRKKYLALKMGKADEDETLNRIFKPIIEPLEGIKVNTYKNKKSKHNERAPDIHIKSEKPPTPTKISMQKTSTTPAFLLDDEVFSQDFEAESSDSEQTLQEVREEYDDMLKYSNPSFDQFLMQFPPLSRYYIEGFITNRSDYDETTGVRLDIKTNKLHIGNKLIHIGDSNEIVLDGIPYEGTNGLYNLLFLKKPVGYSEKDLKNYKEILELSSAHRRNYTPEGEIKGNRFYKYNFIDE